MSSIMFPNGETLTSTANTPDTLATAIQPIRVTGAIQFICPQQVYETLGSRSGISDTITWNGNTYRVQSVGPWADNQFWSAILIRMTGD